MSVTKTVNPLNSILFLSDRDGGLPPKPIRGAMILATPSCISFRCFPEQDGPTEIVLGASENVDPGYHPAFEGTLETPSRKIVVSTVDEQTVLQAAVPKKTIHVRIWLSHPQWPEKVIIGHA